MPAPDVARLLQRCPALFARAPEDRAAPLMAELMGPRLRLAPAAAADALARCPALANTLNPMVPIVRLVVEQQGAAWAARGGAAA